MNTSQNSTAPISRRHFMAAAGLGAAATFLKPSVLQAAAGPAAVTPQNDPTNKTLEIAFLEKWFFDGGNGGPLKYTPEEMAQTCDEIGLDLELTLRKQGHITPENAPTELPIMVAALASRKRRILFLALDTVRPDEPHWERALRTAKQLGITQYRHRGFRYDADKSLKPQIANFNSMARDFAAANKEIGVQALYQIHATPGMAGSAAWDLDMILGDIDPKYFAVAFDARHVMVQQGLSWPNAVKLLAPRTAALCMKSFKWDGNKPVEVPLGQGRVTKDIVDQVIAAHGGPLPVCIHIEHRKLQPIPFAQRASIVEAFRADARVLRGWLGEGPA